MCSPAGYAVSRLRYQPIVLFVRWNFRKESDLHIQGLIRKDIEQFADTMRARGLDPGSLHYRGLGGGDGVLELTQWIVGVSLA